MELHEAIRRRRMVRSFTSEVLEPAVVDRLLDGARRSPSAGNTAGIAFVVLERSDTERYWEVALPAEARASFGWPGLLQAPVLVVVTTSPSAYVARYAEPDKATAGLGSDADAWPVPYWFVDAGMAVDRLLLGAVDAGLGACFFGLFAHERRVLAALDVPGGWRAAGTVAIGHPAADDRPGRSATRQRPSLAEVVHRRRW